MVINNKTLISEISINELKGIPDFVSESFITQVYKKEGDFKIYLFYIYCDIDVTSNVTPIITNFIDDFNTVGSHAVDIYHTDLYIIKGVHELFGIWERMGIGLTRGALD